MKYTFTKAALALAIATLASARTMESLHEVPEGFVLEKLAADNQPIKLKIALTQGDAAGFEKKVMDMSTPSHKSYGAHFQSHEEMKRMLMPSAEAVESVKAWLDSVGIEEYSVDSDWVDFTTTVGKANALLDTEFGWYKSEGSRQLRTTHYAVPDDVAGHVQMVQPTTRFNSLRRHHQTYQPMPETASPSDFMRTAQADKVAAGCGGGVTPQCLKSLYNVNYKSDAASGSKVAFASYLEEYARQKDLASFGRSIYPGAAGRNFSVVLYNGGKDDQTSSSDSGEANLDLQYMLAMADSLPVTEYSTGGRGPLVVDLDQPNENDNEDEPYLEFFQSVLKLDNSQLPQVISTSYGENEQSVPKTYAVSVCNLIAQLGSRGVSVIFSSGDSGTGSACQSNDGKKTTKFQPQYPASCPFVTSVGATENPTVGGESATFFSSGGFSDYWARPSYQDTAVTTYLSSIGSNFAQYYNASGRGFPDIALQGVNYPVVDKGRTVQTQGTSCSAPAFGGLVGLLNDARLRNNKPVLGFLNPLLYSNPTAFTDIVKGKSTGCDGRARFHGAPNGSPVIRGASWNATKGWDPVTGLGTPLFDKLLAAAAPNRFSH